jgi:hypothetical protein
VILASGLSTFGCTGSYAHALETLMHLSMFGFLTFSYFFLLLTVLGFFVCLLLSLFFDQEFLLAALFRFYFFLLND